MTDDERYETGMRIRARCWATPMGRPRRRAHDGLHARLPVVHHPLRLGRRLEPRRLDWRTRSCITLAVALTALGREAEIAMDVRAARRNGLSPEEIGEVLLHAAVYAGVPAANAAFAIAQEVLAEEAAEP